MFEFFCDILVLILDLFSGVYYADERPEAQRFTIGCGLIVFIAIGAIGFFTFWVVRR